MTKHTYDISTANGQMRLMRESVGQPYLEGPINTSALGDHGSDPIGDGTFRMIPSGDIVSFEEMMRRRAMRIIRK